MSVQNTKRRAIFISDFLNPHCFYFKFYDEKFNEQLKSFEDGLAEHAWAKIRNDRFEPKVNDIIAVYNISWSKWVRVIVKNVLVHFDGPRGKQYELWAIDHGQYIKSFDSNSFVPLPIELRNSKCGGIYQGSIHGYGPAILQLNEECLEEEMIPTKHWSPRAIQMCKDLIDKSQIVYFDVKGMHAGYLFGDLNFQMPKSLISLEKCLSDLRQIVRGDFNEEMIASQYIQTDMFTRNTNHQIIKQMKNMPCISPKDRYVQYKGENRDIYKRPEIKNYMDTQNVRIPRPSMSAIESEIDGGVTRIQMNKRLL